MKTWLSSRKPRYVILRIIILLIGAYLILSSIACVTQSRLVYYPTRDWEMTPAELGSGWQDLTLTAADGVKLSAWFLAADRPKGTILICHGNGGNISHRADMMTQFRAMGYSVMIVDYRGYGHSEGSPTEQGTYADARAAWDYLVKDRRVPPGDIVILGESLGGGVAAHLGADVGNSRALILQCTFSSLTDVAAHHYWYLPVRALLRYRYPTSDYVQKITCPVLVIHSPDDEIIPYKFGRKLFESAHEPKQFLQIRGGHNDGCFVSGSAYIDGLAAFLKSCEGK